MDKNTIIEQILVLCALNDTKNGTNKFCYSDFEGATIDEIKEVLAPLREERYKICEERAEKYKAKMAAMKNPLRDAALEAYKSFVDKDKTPMDIELINERSIGDFYNSIHFEDINGIPHMTKHSPINSPTVPGIFLSQIVNQPYDLSSMKEEEIHPFLTKLFYDFFDIIYKSNDGMSGKVIKAMLDKIETINSKNEMYVDKNNQPSFTITVLPKAETTEIYLDFDRPYGYCNNRHVRNKFILNNSSQELTFQDKIVENGDLEIYAKDCLAK